MEKYSTNQAKKLARIYYQDRIWELHQQQKSIIEITNLINKRYIPRSRFKGTTLSRTTIHNVIKKLKEEKK